MSTQFEAAIERITVEPGFAKTVADEGASALSPFDLTDDQRRLLVEALHEDIARRLAPDRPRDVASYAEIPMPAVLALRADPISGDETVPVSAARRGERRPPPERLSAAPSSARTGRRIAG